MQFKNKYVSNIPLIALIAANIIPLWGVVFSGWDAFYIVLLYWSENLAVGFYNVLKMAFASVSKPVEHLGKLFLIPFFTIHYGGFMGVHGLFILALINKDGLNFMNNINWPCFLAFLQILLNVIRQAYSLMPQAMRYALGALFVSHGISFVFNYLIKGEYRSAKPDKLMGNPYGRVAVMHIAIIFGAFLTMALGSPVGILIVLVALKTFLDVIFHLRQHRKQQLRVASV